MTSHAMVWVLAGEVGGAYYGVKHPMKPHRMRMTNELIIEYGLNEHLDVYVSVHTSRCQDLLKQTYTCTPDKSTRH